GFLAHYAQPASVGLRVNTLKLSPEQFARLWPEKLEPIPWEPAGFQVAPEQRPGKHPYHAAGLYYLQDPAAMAAARLLVQAELLAPRPGELVLDLAAAPGGKTTHLAALMQGRGVLIANDPHPGRVRDLARNLERWGARNVAVTNETPERLAVHFGPLFDRVLVDAPCSGEGMFRKDPAARYEWSPKLVSSCALRQDGILAQAAKLVRPGGVLAYSTCTFAAEEDEGTLLRFLQAQPDFEILAAPHFPGFGPGRPDWLEAAPAELAQAVRLWPQHAPGEGHFIALLQRKLGGAPAALKTRKPAALPALARRDYQAFVADSLVAEPAQESLALMGSELYALPSELPDLHGLRVVHWGWWLGTAKKNRFEPSPALAAGLQPGQARQVLDLASTDETLLRYLRGEVVPAEGRDGWVLVGVDGYSLGWGKRVQGRLKSHLPRWLRLIG
ncbi:MAG: RsmF rRNA methyltransferase first C-terminal domain-containing protein, partial [Anaerolineales bacterium]|nr:RsmF rRNA methyltransferase first C-terminal domain-containing protein [Anaerolineales bacterium]